MFTISHKAGKDITVRTKVKPLKKDKLVLKIFSKQVNPADYYFQLWEKYGAAYIVKLILGDSKSFNEHFEGWAFPKNFLFDMVDGSAIILTKEQIKNV